MTVPVVDLSPCTRNTHTYAGEQDHRVLGQNRVAYTSWWANLGQSHDLNILSCETDAGFQVRTHEIDMTEDSPFDHRDKADRLLTEMEASGFLFTLDQMETRFQENGLKTTQFTDDEACACAVLEELE
ncbi:MAG: hypothetical protein AAF826_04630 [Pseudomonadota bacterium]